MKSPTNIYKRLPIYWKLTVWGALLLCLLFTANNAIQYLYVERWMEEREERRLEMEMGELLNQLLAREMIVEPSRYPVIRDYLKRVNARGGMIRLIASDRAPIVYAADDVAPEIVHAALPADGGNGLYKEDGMLKMRRPITIFGFHGTVEIARSMEGINELVSAFFHIMILCCIAAIAISGLGGGLLARQLVKPLHEMNETIANVKRNGLQERMPLDGAKDHIYELKSKFNEMMDQVERSFHRQKQFVEDASHELRTPIAVMEGHLSLLNRWGKSDPEVLDDSLGITLEELGRLKMLVEELLQLSRAEQQAAKSANGCCAHPGRVIEKIVRKMGVAYPGFDLKADANAIEELTLAISDDHLESVLRILIDNAVKYSGDRFEIEIMSTASEQEATISVKDYGIGIDEADLPLVWDRFYRADKSRIGGEGYGLGLSIAQRLVHGAGGTIALSGHPEGGTVASVTLPIARPLK